MAHPPCCSLVEAITITLMFCCLQVSFKEGSNDPEFYCENMVEAWVSGSLKAAFLRELNEDIHKYVYNLDDEFP